MNTTNPWTRRFDVTLTDKALRERTQVLASPISGLASAPSVVAGDLLRAALGNIFVPSRLDTAIIRQLVERARAHAVMHYPDLKTYLRGINAKAAPLQPTSATCLTGLAGSGKTAIVGAMQRLLTDSVVIEPGSGYPSIALQSIWCVTIEACKSLHDILDKPLSRDLGSLSGVKSDEKLVRLASRYAYRIAAALLLVDEFQFVTQSASANALLTKLLHLLRYIGLPLVYVGNFSLVHRLMKRAQEDQHRLLADPIVLLPEQLDDPASLDTLRQYAIASDGALCARPEDVLEQLHDYSAGLRRTRRDLLVLAYRMARQDGRFEVTSNDLKRAYGSDTFTSFRREGVALREQSITGRQTRPDLWCPFDLPKSSTANATARDTKAEQEAMGRQSLLSAMTPDERSGLQYVEGKSDVATRSTPSGSTSRKPRRPAPTFEALLDGAAKVRREILAGKR